MSATTPSTVTVETLAAFSDAWNRHDIDALMGFMSDDCVFQTAAGPDACGTRHVGRDAVRAAFAAAWAAVPDAQWENGRHRVDGEFGVSEWNQRIRGFFSLIAWRICGVESREPFSAKMIS